MKQADVVEAAYKKFVDRLETGFAGCDPRFIFNAGYEAALSAQHSDLADELDAHFEEYNAAEDEGAADQAKLDLSEFVLNAAPSIQAALRSNRAAIVEDTPELRRILGHYDLVCASKPTVDGTVKEFLGAANDIIRSLNGGDHV